MLDPSQRVAQIVLDHSETAAVFQRHKIDFCCKGDQSVTEACGRRGLDVTTVVRDLAAAIAERAPIGDELDLRSLTTPDLIEHIVRRHHAYLRRALPFVQGLSTKVARVHGDHDPNLRELEQLVHELAEALLPHLDEEERALFPALCSSGRDGVGVARALGAMQDDHVTVGALLEQIRAAAGDFAIPDWACRSFRALFSELEQMEGDVLRHVHLENHVLAPRFEAADAAERLAVTAS